MAFPPVMSFLEMVGLLFKLVMAALAATVASSPLSWSCSIRTAGERPRVVMAGPPSPLMTALSVPTGRRERQKSNQPPRRETSVPLAADRVMDSWYSSGGPNGRPSIRMAPMRGRLGFILFAETTCRARFIVLNGFAEEPSPVASSPLMPSTHRKRSASTNFTVMERFFVVVSAGVSQSVTRTRKS